MWSSVLTNKNARKDMQSISKSWLFCQTLPASGSLSHTALAVAAESAFSSSEGPRASLQLLEQRFKHVRSGSTAGSDKHSFDLFVV